MKKFHQRERQLRFEARYPERSAVEFHRFFVIAMGRVIAADDFESAIDNSLENRLAIASRTQRRIHFEVRVVSWPMGALG